jgi:hypothetical protein
VNRLADDSLAFLAEARQFPKLVTPQQKIYAEWQAARAIRLTGRHEQAVALYNDLIPSLEQLEKSGVPFPSFAGDRAAARYRIDRPSAYLNLSASYLSQKSPDYAAARSACSRVLELVPSGNQELVRYRKWALALTALAYQREGNVKAAEATSSQLSELLAPMNTARSVDCRLRCQSISVHITSR